MCSPAWVLIKRAWAHTVDRTLSAGAVTLAVTQYEQRAAPTRIDKAGEWMG